MCIPLTTAILEGKLRPVALKEKGISRTTYRLMIGRLNRLCGVGEGLGGKLQETLREWTDGELDMRVGWMPTEGEPSEEDTCLLRDLRSDEMIYEAGISYAGPMKDALTGEFYEALLRVEACWLKQEIRSYLRNVRTDNEARNLVCRVLDQLYQTGYGLDERKEDADELRLLLKGAIASLYLELAAEFGCWMEVEDFLDYETLTSDECFGCPSEDKGAAVYEAWKLFGQVKRFIVYSGLKYGWMPRQGDATDRPVMTEQMQRECRKDAMIFYQKDLKRKLLNCERSESASFLKMAVWTMENYLFYLYAPLTKGMPHYNQLVDEEWIDRQVVMWKGEECGGHLDCVEGRAASHWVERKLDESKYRFFLPEQSGEGGSIPRRLYDYLKRMRMSYENHFTHSFRPIEPERQMPVVPAVQTVHKRVDMMSIQNAFSFLCERKGRDGEVLMSAHDVQQLTACFFTFLNEQSVINIHLRRKLTLPGGHAGVVYGAIFVWCYDRKEDKVLYADFVHAVFHCGSERDNLVKNSSHHVDMFRRYINNPGVK